MLVVAFFHGDVLKVLHCVESGIAIQSAEFLIGSHYMELVDEAVERILYVERLVEWFFPAAVVGIRSGHYSTVYADACQWAECDEREGIFSGMIIRAFH